MAPPRPVQDTLARLERSGRIDTVVEQIRPRLDRALPEGATRTRALRGDWVGHPLHPMLTDLVIGFWTTAWILDLAGRRRDREVADAFVALGLITFAPTAITGWADWTERSPAQQRVGVVHAVTNGAAATVYAASWVARRRGSRTLGVALGHVGATIATVGGYLGGHLAFPPEEAEPHIERSN